MVTCPIARDAGILEKNGVTANITGTGKVPEAMSAGQMDAGYVGATTVARAYGKGAPIRVVATNHRGGSFYLVLSNAIKSPDDLIGKSISLGSTPQPNWVAIATQLGIPWEFSNYNTVATISDHDDYLALVAGKLDAFIACDPWGSMAEYNHVGWIASTYLKLPDGSWGSCCDLSMRDGFIEEHRELAKACVKSHVEAQQFIYDHPHRSADMFATSYDVPYDIAMKTLWRKCNAEGNSMSWELDVSEKVRTFAWYKSFGIEDFENYADPTEWCDNTLLKEIKADDFETFIENKVEPYFPSGISLERFTELARKRDGA
jgi:NitT/TauT family transport system substrate-binding protein